MVSTFAISVLLGCWWCRTCSGLAPSLMRDQRSTILSFPLLLFHYFSFAADDVGLVVAWPHPWWEISIVKSDHTCQFCCIWNSNDRDRWWRRICGRLDSSLIVVKSDQQSSDWWFYHHTNPIHLLYRPFLVFNYSIVSTFIISVLQGSDIWYEHWFCGGKRYDFGHSCEQAWCING